MKNIWVKLGCFLTGHNYSIIRNSSEASSKAVKKYLAALIIISTLWGFIGYSFTQRYLHGSLLMSIIGAIIMVIIVIQIERQIILAVHKNKITFIFRTIIGIIMAIIGSVIIDQILFKDDVEKKQISNIQTDVNKILPIKTKELREQILQLDSTINDKEYSRNNINNDIMAHPTIPTISYQTTHQKNDSNSTGQTINTIINTQIANPKQSLLAPLDEQLKYLRKTETDKQNQLLTIRDLLEKDLSSKIGFLDELKLLFDILLSSGIALFVWSLFFLLLLSIELFVLLNKYGDNSNDYDKTVVHQMEIRIKMLEKLVGN